MRAACRTSSTTSSPGKRNAPSPSLSPCSTTRCCSSWSGPRQPRRRSAKRVTVVDYPDGRIAIRYKGEDLAYRTFDKIRKVNQAAVVENKRLGSLLEMIKTYQETQPQEKRSRKAPKRRDQTGHMFSVG